MEKVQHYPFIWFAIDIARATDTLNTGGLYKNENMFDFYLLFMQMGSIIRKKEADDDYGKLV